MRKKISAYLLGSVVLSLTACTTTKPLSPMDAPEQSVTIKPDYPSSGSAPVQGPLSVKVGETKLRFINREFTDLPSMADADWIPALDAFKRSCPSLKWRKGWASVCDTAQQQSSSSARLFFTRHFNVYEIQAVTRSKDKSLQVQSKGMMTGYYEPLLHGSRVQEGVYQVPLLAEPNDLITVDLDQVHPQLKGLRLRGKVQGQKLVPYDTRAGIVQRKELNQRAIAWVQNPVDAFFLQVQGSGRILLSDGQYVRLGYANNNGYSYRAIGRYMVDRGYLKWNELSMQNIRAWAEKHPDKIQDVLNQNPSYIFFTERKSQSYDEGPIGAQGVPLTSMGSIAVDKRYYQYGWPMIVDIKQSRPALRMTRAVVAQDTGAAIKGAIRYDFFWGFGEKAGELAGRQKSEVKAWVMLPKGVRPPQ